MTQDEVKKWILERITKACAYLNSDKDEHMKAPYASWKLDNGKFITALEKSGFNIGPLTAALFEFIEDIEDTGGVIEDGMFVAPAAEPGWTNLGDTYINVCKAIGRKPKKRKGSLDGLSEAEKLLADADQVVKDAGMGAKKLPEV